jgi:hypothetical protein
VRAGRDRKGGAWFCRCNQPLDHVVDCPATRPSERSSCSRPYLIILSISFPSSVVARVVCLTSHRIVSLLSDMVELSISNLCLDQSDAG